MALPAISYQQITFTELVAKYQDLKIFKPALIGPRGGWSYLGPTAVGPEGGDQVGLIVKANVPDALTEVLDWEPVFIDIETQRYSTWRGIAPEGYVVIGHFFVTGIEKPTPEQTEGIRAIRKDLIGEQEPNRQIWSQRLPFANLTLWDVITAVLIYIPTGAFVSKNGTGSTGLLIGLLIFNAAAQTTW